MADIFVSYASADRERIAPLVGMLEEMGWTLWWDRQLHGGSYFPQEIEDEATGADTILVAWSSASIGSPWVADEAQLGRDEGKLIPLILDPVMPPMGFRQIHTLDFSSWTPGQNDATFQSLVTAIKRLQLASTQIREAQPVAAPSAAIADEPPAVSIAVLPFVNMSADPEQDYFSDGISEELLNLLAKIKQTHVAARTSSFQFKGSDLDVPAIGRALNVAHVLEGSVRKAGNRVRITAQLIEAKSGYHHWSETYDRELIDVFEIQDEISAAIVEALKPHLLENPEAPVASRSHDIKAYDLFLLGQQQLKSRNAKDVEKGKDYFEEALDLDANFAPALAELALAHLLLSDGFGGLGVTPLQEASSLASDLIARALAEEPESVEALLADAYRHQLQRQYDDARESALKVLDINPNEARAWSILSAAAAQSGDPANTQGLYRRKILELDPLSVGGHRAMAHHYYSRGDFSKAQVMIDKLKSLSPTSGEVTVRQTWCCLNKGQFALGLGKALKDPAHWQEVTVRRALLPLMIFLGEGAEVEDFDPTFAFHYYMQAGLLDDARRLSSVVASHPSQGTDYRLAVDLARWRTLDGDLEGAAKLLAPFDEADPDRWGLHYHLTYGLIGATLALHLRSNGHAQGEADLYRDRLQACYEAMQNDRDGVHLIAGRVGATLSLQAGDSEAALTRLERQQDYSLYGTYDCLGLPNFQSLESEPRYQAITGALKEHLREQRDMAAAQGYLEAAVSLLKQ